MLSTFLPRLDPGTTLAGLALPHNSSVLWKKNRISSAYDQQVCQWMIPTASEIWIAFWLPSLPQASYSRKPSFLRAQIVTLLALAHVMSYTDRCQPLTYLRSAVPTLEVAEVAEGILLTHHQLV